MGVRFLRCARCPKLFHARQDCSAKRTGTSTLRARERAPRRRHMLAESRTLAELGRQIESGSITAQAATEGCLARIAERNRSLNAYITVLVDQALSQAKELDREIAAGRHRGPLHGIPI